MKKRDLYICNSVYQILVALWIKRSVNPDVPGDILISNHMNNGQALADKVQAEGIFEQVIYAESFDYARYRTPHGKLDRYKEEWNPVGTLNGFCKINACYTGVYLANPDRFSQLVFNALARRNPAVRAVLFEDGMLTYSPIFLSDVESSRIQMDKTLKSILYNYVFRRKSLCDHISHVLLFHPKDLGWNPDFPVRELAKIDTKDEEFRYMCNRVFGYDENPDAYDRKYLFMEESFAAEGVPINDIELLNKLAERVGKENIMVKIHPRNPVNRFAEEGYKTNRNASIPWELIVMNMDDACEMTLITVASSSVLNPMLIFGKQIKAYSLYNLVDKESCKSRLLSGSFWETVYKVFQENSDVIQICNSIDDIQ